MNHIEETVRAPDGSEIFVQEWQPAQPAQACLLIVHGYGEHSGRYEHVGEFFGARRLHVFSFDQRGHGRSAGKQGLIRSLAQHVDDVGLMVERVYDRAPDLPIFLLGHSMGGLVATLFGATHRPQLNGLITSSALLKLGDDISPLLVRASKILGIIVPTLPTISLPTHTLSRDPSVEARYRADPLTYNGRVLARTGAEMNSAIARVQQVMEQITLPLLVMHGTADGLVDPEGSQQLYARAHSADKMLKLYDGFFHELLNEPEKEEVMDNILSWISARYQPIQGAD